MDLTPLPADPEDRTRGPVHVLLCAPGHPPYSTRLAKVGFTIQLHQGAQSRSYELSGIDAAGRLVYRLVARPASPLLARHQA